MIWLETYPGTKCMHTQQTKQWDALVNEISIEQTSEQENNADGTISFLSE